MIGGFPSALTDEELAEAFEVAKRTPYDLETVCRVFEAAPGLDLKEPAAFLVRCAASNLDPLQTLAACRVVIMRERLEEFTEASRQATARMKSFLGVFEAIRSARERAPAVPLWFKLLRSLGYVITGGMLTLLGYAVYLREWGSVLWLAFGLWVIFWPLPKKLRDR